MVGTSESIPIPLLAAGENNHDWLKSPDANTTQDSPISDEIMDRIVHNAYVIFLAGKSLRERHGLAAQMKGEMAE